MLSIRQLKSILITNHKVTENYLFMTLLQVLNMGFYLIIYPVMIRRMGAESYGLYSFAWSIACISMVFVNFGFDLPGAKRIAEIEEKHVHGDLHWRSEMGQVISEVLIAKIGIEIILFAIAMPMLLWIPVMSQNKLLFALGFLQTVNCILFPQWYFQGIQQLRHVTYIQLTCKLLSLPFIFIFVKDGSDAWLLMMFGTLAAILGGVIAWCMIRFKEHIPLPSVSLQQLKVSYRQATPFFLSNAMAVIKEQGVILLIGSFLGMADVAIYDLANKLITGPRILLLKVNDALYPMMVTRGSTKKIKKIMLFEMLLGIMVIITVVVLGEWVIALLGGQKMLPAYGVSIVLSTTVLFWMLGTAFIYFIFIPTGYNRMVTWNQVVSLCSCMIVSIVWLLIHPNVYAPAFGVAISGLCEVLFCSFISHKFHLRNLITCRN